MYVDNILVSPIQHSDKPGHEGEYFEVFRSNGSISRPNGTHIGHSCEGTRSNYLKEEIYEAKDMDEFNLLKNWYIKIMPNLIHSIVDRIGFDIRETTKDINDAFPKEE